MSTLTKIIADNYVVGRHRIVSRVYYCVHSLSCNRMKLSGVPNQLRAVRRRGGPIAQMLVLLMFLPPCAGCWWQRHTRRESTVDPATAAATYYQEAIANTAAPYNTGVALEIPMNPPPLTSREPEAKEKWEMTLHEAIELALKHSKIIRTLRGAEASAYDPAIAEARILQELGRFDTQLIFNLFWNKDENQINSNVAGGGIVPVTAGVPFVFQQDGFGGVSGRNTGLPGSGDILSLRKLLATGGEVTAGFNTDYDLTNVTGSRAFRASYNTRFFSTFRQPLLQGAGVEMNRMPIIIARLQADGALWEFKRAVAELVRDVEQKYWELAISLAQLQALDLSIEINLQVVERIKRKLEEGSASEAELKQAEVQLHNLRGERINAFSGAGPLSPSRQRLLGGPVLVVEQQLRELLGLPPADRRRIVPVDEPSVAPVVLDWQSTVNAAFTYSPEIQALKLLVAARHENLMMASDGLKPKLDVFVRKDFTGLGGEFDDSIREVNHGGFGGLTAGLQFQYEFGYRKAAGLVQQRRMELEKEREGLRHKGEEVEFALAQQYQRIVSDLDAYQIKLQALEAAKRQLELTRALYDEGRIELDRLFDSVRSYADLVTEEIALKSSYQISLINLELTKGTIFQYNNIHMHEGPWPPAAYPQAAQQAEDRARAIEWYHGPAKKMQMDEHEKMPVYDGQETISPEHHHEPGPESMRMPDKASTSPLEIPVDLGSQRPTKRPANSNEFILPSSLELSPSDSGSSSGSPERTSDP